MDAKRTNLNKRRATMVESQPADDGTLTPNIKHVLKKLFGPRNSESVGAAERLQNNVGRGRNYIKKEKFSDLH